jgi:hypothetical protein
MEDVAHDASGPASPKPSDIAAPQQAGRPDSPDRGKLRGLHLLQPRRPAREGKPGRETAQSLQEVAWFALFAREFTKALAAADRAHALLPDDLTIETNRAHASSSANAAASSRRSAARSASTALRSILRSGPHHRRGASS